MTKTDATGTYFLSWVDSAGAPHQTIAPMPESQVESTIRGLAVTGNTQFQVWVGTTLFITDDAMIVGGKDIA